jgi:hypothetical protein
MNEVSRDTATLSMKTSESSTLCLERLARCLQLSNAWRLYFAHNVQLRKLLEHVAELSYRDCVQHGLKAQADRLVQTQPCVRRRQTHV